MTVNGNVVERLTATTSREADIKTHNMKLIISLQDSLGKTAYPKLTKTFDFIVNPATCDCTLLTWDYPAAQSVSTTVKRANVATLNITKATVNAASKTTTPAIRRCYELNATPPQTPCDETTAVLSIVDNATTTIPAFMSLTGTVLTVNPDNNIQSKTYTMKTTMSTVNNGNLNWTTVAVTVANCVITAIIAPTAPASTSYKIFALSPLVMDLTSPGFI